MDPWGFAVERKGQRLRLAQPDPHGSCYGQIPVTSWGCQVGGSKILSAVKSGIGEGPQESSLCDIPTKNQA